MRGTRCRGLMNTKSLFYLLDVGRQVPIVVRVTLAQILKVEVAVEAVDYPSRDKAKDQALQGLRDWIGRPLDNVDLILRPLNPTSQIAMHQAAQDFTILTGCAPSPYT